MVYTITCYLCVSSLVRSRRRRRPQYGMSAVYNQHVRHSTYTPLADALARLQRSRARPLHIGLYVFLSSLHGLWGEAGYQCTGLRENLRKLPAEDLRSRGLLAEDHLVEALDLLRRPDA